MRNKKHFDITKKEFASFDQTVRRWNHLNCEEHDEVISRSLDRFETKSRVYTISRPVRWLVCTASRVRLEILRERQKRLNLIAAIKESSICDRWLNGRLLFTDETVVEEQSENACLSSIRLAVQTALDQLSPVDRQIAELCGVMDLKPAEVGRRLSMCRSTVKSRWERLQKRLRQDPDLQAAISSERRVAG